MKRSLQLLSRCGGESTKLLNRRVIAPPSRNSSRSRTTPAPVSSSIHTHHRAFSTSCRRHSGAASNPQLSFPCLDAVEARTHSLLSRPHRNNASSTAGPEPSYAVGATETFTSTTPLLLDYGGVLYQFTIAYEAWGALNKDKSNAILLQTGLSASSHAHSNPKNPNPGWWEKFIGPGKPLDTNEFFIICTNVLGGCYGSTGPGSIDPADGERYATRFPILTIQDMVRGQFRLLDHLNIDKLHATVGASMGSMQSLAAGILFPDRINRIVSISGCARSHPYGIAMRYAQRQVLMADPNWNRGFYYNGIPPHLGMKLARQIATITYRSGPEWEQRFGRERADPARPPALCPDFLIETYLDHAGEKWCLEYDANSLLYVSKAMDLFDLSASNMGEINEIRARNAYKLDLKPGSTSDPPTDSSTTCTLTLPSEPYTEQPRPSSATTTASSPAPSTNLINGLSPLRNHKSLVLGVASDILFPAWQQREIANALVAANGDGDGGNVRYVELSEEQSMFGHDTFLLDLVGVGGEVGRFLKE